LWILAHREMEPYGRRPSIHLVDRLVAAPTRGWLRDHLAAMALATLSSEYEPQDDGRRRFRFIAYSPTIMGRVSVRVVLEHDREQVVNAFPTRPIGRRR
jgi:hypothetical protein